MRAVREMEPDSFKPTEQIFQAEEMPQLSSRLTSERILLDVEALPSVRSVKETY